MSSNIAVTSESHLPKPWTFLRRRRHPNLGIIGPYSNPEVFVVRILRAISRFAMACSRSGCFSRRSRIPFKRRCASAICLAASGSGTGLGVGLESSVLIGHLREHHNKEKDGKCATLGSKRGSAPSLVTSGHVIAKIPSSSHTRCFGVCVVLTRRVFLLFCGPMLPNLAKLL